MDFGPSSSSFCPAHPAFFPRTGQMCGHPRRGSGGGGIFKLFFSEVGWGKREKRGRWKNHSTVIGKRRGGDRRGRRFVGSVGCVKGGNSPEPPPSLPIAPCQEIKLRPREHVWEMAFWCQEGKGRGGGRHSTLNGD